eukprot:2937319-Prymnesium_polylepis.2
MPPLALASPSEAGAGPGQAHIPGYTGYQPGKREKFGLSSTEASREILANLTSTEDFHPLIPLEGKRPDSVYDAHIDKDGIASVMDGFAMTEKGNVGAKVIVNAGFTPAYLKHEKEAQARQLAHSDPHARAPFGVDPTGTSLGKVDYTTVRARPRSRRVVCANCILRRPRARTPSAGTPPKVPTLPS